MTDEHPPQHAPGNEVSHDFLCPACGYWCATTWETSPAHAAKALFYARGKILMTLARMMPLRTVCIHPDGTSRYGGSDIANAPWDTRRHLVSPAEAEAILADVPPLADLRAPKDIEDALLLAL